MNVCNPFSLLREFGKSTLKIWFMKSISNTKLFTQYIKLFPEIPFPLTLHQDAHHDFSIQNQSIRQEYLNQYVHPFIEKQDDEFTEFIPCFVLREEKHFIAVVLWRAGLMEYEYFLITYNNAGDSIDHQVIAGMKSDGERVIIRIAMIDDDSSIHMVEGTADELQLFDYDPQKTRKYSFEFTHDGHIILEQ